MSQNIYKHGHIYDKRIVIIIIVPVICPTTFYWRHYCVTARTSLTERCRRTWSSITADVSTIFHLIPLLIEDRCWHFIWSKNLSKTNFTFMWPCCLVTNFFVIKPTRCTNFTNLFWHETLHVSDSSSVHRQEFIHCTLSNGLCDTGVEQDGIAGSILVLLLYDIYHCWVYSE